jgi:uncharacterized protein involved in type VI secretion and phage assembly
MRPLDALLAADSSGGAFPGVAVGVVTSNADPMHLARVKVRFPALSDTVESAWASVVTPMAGAQRGVYLIPEVGDAVLVAFELGDVNRPFVLGGFWAGPQKPPQGDDPHNDQRLIRSRSGHVVRLDDTDGAERIQIVDKSGKNSITIETTGNKITVKGAGPVTVSTDGDLKLTAQGGVTISGRQVEISAKQQLSLSGQAGAELKSTGALTVRGSTVDIN